MQQNCYELINQLEKEQCTVLLGEQCDTVAILKSVLKLETEGFHVELPLQEQSYFLQIVSMENRPEALKVFLVDLKTIPLDFLFAFLERLEKAVHFEDNEFLELKEDIVTALAIGSPRHYLELNREDYYHDCVKLTRYKEVPVVDWDILLCIAENRR